MTEPLAFLNGRFLPQSHAALPFDDAGFIFGATVTDLCRTFRHRLFRLENHLRRFRQSCRLARVPQPRTDGELVEIAERLVDSNAQLLKPKDDLALVMFATPGEIGYYLGKSGGAGEGSPTLGMHTFPLPFHRFVRLFREGAHLVVPPTRHIPSECVSPRIKQRSRLHWWLAEQEAHAVDPAASALLLDLEGHITETAAANLLLVRDGRVLSPRRQRILGGISLLVVEELCGELGLRFEEADLVIEDCYLCEEAMLTSTPYCMAPVSRINQHALPPDGPVLERLLSAWSERVGLDIRGQVLKGS